MRHLRTTIGQASRTTRWGDLARWAGGLLPLGFFAISAIAIRAGFETRLDRAAADVVAGLAFFVHFVIVVQLALAIFRAGKGMVGRRVRRLAGQFALSFFTCWGMLAYVDDALSGQIWDRSLAVLPLWYAIVLLPTLVIFGCCYGLGRIARGDDGGGGRLHNGMRDGLQNGA